MLKKKKAMFYKISTTIPMATTKLKKSGHLETNIANDRFLHHSNPPRGVSNTLSWTKN